MVKLIKFYFILIMSFVSLLPFMLVKDDQRWQYRQITEAKFRLDYDLRTVNEEAYN